MSLTIAYKYITCDINREEVEIIYDSFSIFSPKYLLQSDIGKIRPKRNSTRAWATFRKQYNAPNLETYNQFKESFEKFYDTVKSSRWMIKNNNNKYGVKLFENDSVILDHIITNYLAKKKDTLESGKVGHKEEKFIFHIHKECTEHLLDDMKQINMAMKLHRIYKMGYQ